MQHRLTPRLVLLLFFMLPIRAHADEATKSLGIFAPKNLVAWCIVPFDASKRGPVERAEMIKRLGLSRVAYDWRQEHVPTFEQEIEAYAERGIEFFAFWSWHDSMERLIRKHGIRPQIWITLPSPSEGSQQQRVAAAANAVLPMVQKTRELGLNLGLYNHGGWGGEPENLVAVCRYLREQHQGDHVGIVYNFHHGHPHVERFADSLEQMIPYLLCLNLNGMMSTDKANGGKNKIVPIGKGEHERGMIREVLRQNYLGPIGILDHRNDMDSEEALRANLIGLASIVDEMK